MPLRNHFLPPLSVTHPWRGFHSAWANALARRLNEEVLPEGYWAIPNVDLGGPIEIDIATVQGEEAKSEEVGTPAAPWAPPAPTQTLAVDFTHLDAVEVQVFHDEDGPLLRGAIELVSPSNKDRPSERRAFAVKCASYLAQGVGVVVVDVVTTRRANLHQELLRTLEWGNGACWESPTQLYTTAYRTTVVDGQPRLQMWLEALSLGESLPCLPLWLGESLSVPIDLEASYLAACAALRLRLEA
jgi:hypothetical protein